MPVGKHTDPQIKADIIHEVRELGLPVVEAAAKYGVSSKTIYAWASQCLCITHTYFCTIFRAFFKFRS